MSQPLDLEAIKAREQAATPGPWHRAPNRSLWIQAEDPGVEPWWIAKVDDGLPNPSDDIAFIAHSRTDVPALVAEVERLKKIINEYRSRTISYRVDL